MLSRSDLVAFDCDAYGRTRVFVRLLDGIRKHAFLRPRLALKGGAALGLFGRDLTRLPNDIDFAYVGAVDRPTMLAERPQLLPALVEVIRSCGIDRPAMIEGDINFLVRAPLWPPVRSDSHVVGGARGEQVLVSDDHELAASKLVAVLARSASCDLFDARALLRRWDLERARLRLAFVVYGALSSLDWRTVSVASITANASKVRDRLLPLLRFDLRPAITELEAWSAQLAADTRRLMVAVLPLEAHEREFLDRLYDAGEIAPELLTPDRAQRAVIRDHPGLMSKVREIRQRRGMTADGDPETDPMLPFRFHVSPRS